jgi:YgiT-type zinc finger domain-containing protein
MAAGVPANAAAMKCVVCRQGQTRPGKITAVLQRGGATVVINDVPARVCKNCGEEYVDEGVAGKVLAAAEASAPRRRQGQNSRLRCRVIRRRRR